MPGKPQFHYFLYHLKNSVKRNSKDWETLLPLDRSSSQRVSGLSISHGNYFCAVRSFLEKNSFEIIKTAVSEHINRKVKTEAIEKIGICLEKHGEFYHPSRIEVLVDSVRIPFVLNVALSDAGKKCLAREYNLLKKLNKSFMDAFVPKAYGKGESRTNDGFELSMFLGEWFDGFNEFHISIDPSDKKQKVVVWDPVEGSYFLAEKKTMELYRQAAMILTFYYDIETYEQISLWHHAAGDFVMKCHDNKIDVKLVTVRQYAPMFESSGGVKSNDQNIDTMLGAALAFLLNLSIRMRLDRIDGVGDIVWSDNIAVEGTVQGFLKGLSLKSPSLSIPDSFLACFQDYISFFTESDLYDLSKDIVKRYHPESPDVPVIKQHLKNHVEDLYNAINL